MIEPRSSPPFTSSTISVRLSDHLGCSLANGFGNRQPAQHPGNFFLPPSLIELSHAGHRSLLLHRLLNDEMAPGLGGDLWQVRNTEDLVIVPQIPEPLSHHRSHRPAHS